MNGGGVQSVRREAHRLVGRAGPVPGQVPQALGPGLQDGRVVGGIGHCDTSPIMAGSVPGSGAPGDSDSPGLSEVPSGFPFAGPPGGRLYRQGRCRGCGVPLFGAAPVAREICGGDCPGPDPHQGEAVE